MHTSRVGASMLDAFIAKLILYLCVEKARYIRRSKKTVVPAHTIMIRRVTVTPTRILLFPPERETSNSVLRQFENTDSFIRVSFADEDSRVKVSRPLKRHVQC
jgi:RNA-dependent RNA polymerase